MKLVNVSFTWKFHLKLSSQVCLCPHPLPRKSFSYGRPTLWGKFIRKKRFFSHKQLEDIVQLKLWQWESVLIWRIKVANLTFTILDFWCMYLWAKCKQVLLLKIGWIEAVFKCNQLIIQEGRMNPHFYQIRFWQIWFGKSNEFHSRGWSITRNCLLSKSALEQGY